VDSDSVTIRDAADLWLTTSAARGLERATLAAYEQHSRLHIVPPLGRVKLSRLSAPENKAALVTTVPMGRLGLTEELANAIVFIASDEASYITGHILNVDGGKTVN
jgi:NAD(P)-dependent dehydrogenase (short-subunit alcohol dehydrogenase family)